MKVGVVGTGGREHALAWSLARSSRVREVVALPGNDGMRTDARCVPSVSPTDGEALVELARSERLDLVVVGPEAPLAAGVADLLRAADVPVIGPGRDGAMLEASKAFAKRFMVEHGVPTARFETFQALAPALDYLRAVGAPIVVKDSGLASGKGVTVASTLDKAEDALRGVFAKRHAEVVLEEYLIGREVSVMGFTDGEAFVPLPPAEDHKQLRDGDLGPMTGGMGAVAPAGHVDEATAQRIDREIVEPVLRGLRRDGIDYRGAIFLGIMITDDGPKLLEINVRLGDPETQTVVPLLDGDLVDLLEAVHTRTLSTASVRWSRAAAATVVLAAAGYPGRPEVDVPIGLPTTLPEGVLVFHAATRWDGSTFRSSGGRVLAVTAVGDALDAAIDRAYRFASAIDFPGAQMRSDVGRRQTSHGTGHAR